MHLVLFQRQRFTESEGETEVERGYMVYHLLVHPAMVAMARAELFWNWDPGI